MKREPSINLFLLKKTLYHFDLVWFCMIRFFSFLSTQLPPFHVNNFCFAASRMRKSWLKCWTVTSICAPSFDARRSCIQLFLLSALTSPNSCSHSHQTLPTNLRSGHTRPDKVPRSPHEIILRDISCFTFPFKNEGIPEGKADENWIIFCAVFEIRICKNGGEFFLIKS